MADRDTLVEKLVTTLHLNVAEREALGSDSILKSEVISVISRVLKKSGWFPANAAPWQQGRPVFEGHFLELLPAGGTRLWWQRGLATSLEQLAEQRRWEFEDQARAIEEFVAKEWARTQIDGIQIEG
jgi:hypothetical protein